MGFKCKSCGRHPSLNSKYKRSNTAGLPAAPFCFAFFNDQSRSRHTSSSSSSNNRRRHGGSSENRVFSTWIRSYLHGFLNLNKSISEHSNVTHMALKHPEISYSTKKMDLMVLSRKHLNQDGQLQTRHPTLQKYPKQRRTGRNREHV